MLASSYADTLSVVFEFHQGKSTIQRGKEQFRKEKKHGMRDEI